MIEPRLNIKIASNRNDQAQPEWQWVEGFAISTRANLVMQPKLLSERASWFPLLARASPVD